MNVYGIILELAKQELVQKPYIMLCYWKKCLSALKLSQSLAQFLTLMITIDTFFQQIEMLSY